MLYTWQPTTPRLQKLRAGYVLISIPRRPVNKTERRAIKVANTLFDQTFRARNLYIILIANTQARKGINISSHLSTRYRTKRYTRQS